MLFKFWLKPIKPQPIPQNTGQPLVRLMERWEANYTVQEPEDTEPEDTEPEEHSVDLEEEVESPTGGLVAFNTPHHLKNRVYHYLQLGVQTNGVGGCNFKARWA